MQALALIETPDHVCGRYRIRPFAEAVEASGGSLRVEGLERSPARRAAQLRRAREFDAVVLQRKLLPWWQLAILRKSSRRLLFDFDDAVAYRDSNDARGPLCPRRMARFRRLMGVVDGVLAGNGFLADLARTAGAPADAVQVIPTCIRTDAYRIDHAKVADERLQLVWIGSSSTLTGLERRREVWERIGREVPGTSLKVVCDRFPDFGPLVVVAVPWSEATEAAELAAAGAGVSWIPDDLWSRGKCGLKVLQFMAAGLPVVANPVGVHPEMIRPGETGELATTADEWVDVVHRLAHDPDARLRMGRAARRLVETNYSVEVWAPRFVAALQGRPSIHAPRRVAPSVAVAS